MRLDSNQEPPRYKLGALTIELRIPIPKYIKASSCYWQGLPFGARMMTMETLIIPKSLTKQGELVIISRRDYKQLLAKSLRLKEKRQSS